ncbi:hypothetical protein L1987_53841 [Smallanthus sonchifolius]|uniref:Uncharacterized protein n=1 Tax=Smallanthus sonchifolius TaxID=185202 RepID=A0ACB9EWZ3_9ASTR|nr:hypothetical protein L1987_53841 [Smallanthus sonchifolius]
MLGTLMMLIITSNTFLQLIFVFFSSVNAISTHLEATEDMNVKPTVALRAILVGGIAVFAKIAGAAKAAVAVTAAASATMAGSKQDGNQSAK